VKVGDKVMIKGRAGDLAGIYTVIRVYVDEVIVKHSDYATLFRVKKSECIEKISKSE
tara:strand:- start:970 stop:1140 length:171 start_codon:yes stop_codon:yes gene_type:complete